MSLIDTEAFNGWIIKDELGKGGYSSVYLTEKGDQKSATKHIIIPDDIEFKELSKTKTKEEILEYCKPKLYEETNILKKLQGIKGIVCYLDQYIREYDKRAGWEIFIQMEYLKPLDAYISEIGITVKKVLDMAFQICCALEECSKLDVLHRDIKESNILVDEKGDFKLGDFGVSKYCEGFSFANTVVGTRGYMAPEVIRGDKYNHRADIYSLGIVIYKLLNKNRMPFMPENGSVLEYEYAKRCLREGKDLLPPEFGASDVFRMIKKACEFHPKNRYSSFLEMAKSIEKILLSSDPCSINQQCLKPANERQVEKTTVMQIEEKEEKEPISAKAQSESAQAFYWGNCYYYGRGGVDQNIQKAILWYEKAAKLGHIVAQTNLGDCFFNGEGVSKDYKRAFFLYKMAAEEGYSEAQFSTGECYFYGHGIKSADFEESVKWYEKSADQGHLEAQFKLGFCYEYKVSFENNLNEAFKWYEIAAKKGHALAQFHLGECYFYSKGVKKNYEEAFKYFEKSANQACLDAQYKMGYCYEHNKGVNTNYEESYKWFKIAAENGHMLAQHELGDCYYYGRGVNLNYKEAIKWFKKSAKQGNPDAQFSVGECYFNGIGVDEDYKEAIKWYEKAASKGQLDAQYRLGYCHEHWKGVECNPDELVKWYKMAAEKGHVLAQQSLGDCYYYTKGVKQDYQEAAKWYGMAAKQGNAEAQINYGNCFCLGRGVPENFQIAKDWYEKASKQGNAEAEFYLGLLYFYGNGVAIDKDKAIEYYKRAVNKGSIAAKNELDKLLH